MCRGGPQSRVRAPPGPARLPYSDGSNGWRTHRARSPRGLGHHHLNASRTVVDELARCLLLASGAGSPAGWHGGPARDYSPIPATGNDDTHPAWDGSRMGGL